MNDATLELLQEDTVERLRACDCSTHCKSGCIQEKAADEIERLRAENKRLQAALIEAAEMVAET
jgi:hypothetical protein